MAQRVVTDLSDRGYLDDAAFARRWVETRAGRGYGPARLAAELRTRGVASALIDAALARDAADELERARAVARRRLPALARTSRERAAARLAQFLLRRGHSRPVVARVVRELLGASLEADEA